VGNAIKFTDTGEVVVRVDATSATVLDISVSDTGIGMSAADIARVFEDFTQGQGGIARRYGGTGLGLAIVRRLVGMMRGEVSLTAAPGQGLTALVTLEMPLHSGPSQFARPMPMTDLPPMTVLAAEDNATNRIILASLLQTLGISVEITTSGDAALDRWEPGRFDAVLLDIAMPGRDGMSTLAALQAKAAALGAAPPLAVAVTANAMTHQVEEYLSHGFACCVAKPLRPERLAEALRICHARLRPE
jgi:CheY-like chemotaxis protein